MYADAERDRTLTTSECPLLTSDCIRELTKLWSSRRYSRAIAN